jgi:hypothetical protein
MDSGKRGDLRHVALQVRVLMGMQILAEQFERCVFVSQA